ncbi:MAG: haloacid dehalogenase type II [Nocardioidaceae bacterium]
MHPVPKVVVFDVNETLSDMSPIASRFADVGAPGHLAGQWFAALLRDGFATALTDSQAPFADLGSVGLRGLLSTVDLDRDLEAAIDHVMTGFASLSVHPDVVAGIRALERAGFRLVTLSNGAAAVADRLFTTAGVRDAFEELLSVEDAGIWKPAARAYEFAAHRCQVDTSEMLLVAVHPWDIHGAAHAGLQTGWINRTGAPYPTYFTPPDRAVTSLTELADQLAR